LPANNDDAEDNEAEYYLLMFIYVVCDAKVRTLFYIASDLSETLRMINEISPTIYQQIETP